MPSHKDIAAQYRELPPVDTLLEGSEGLSMPRQLRLAWIREVLEEARSEIQDALVGPDSNGALPAVGREDWTRLLASRLAERYGARSNRTLRRVVNATGVLLHTNLGRSPLSADSGQAIVDVVAGYSNLEMDLGSGSRRSRLEPIRQLLPRVTGAEAGIAVHNNAAAVFLTLIALASGKEVIVSRGHLVEIGGSFRLPTIMEASGAILVEVGATNRTRLSDYADAITDQTGMILKVHPSNFQMVGFTEEVPAQDLAALAKEHAIPLFDDVGSGALDQHEELAFGEPRVQESLRAGADLVSFSGDKLIGGPQSGMIVGREPLISRLNKHPVARVVRLDKVALASLEATLEAYLDPASLRQKIPFLALLSRTESDLDARAEQLATRLETVLGQSWKIGSIEVTCEVGGGSLPGLELPSRAVTLESNSSPDSIARTLREADPPVVGRIERDRFLLDVRTLLDGEEELVARSARSLVEA